MADTALLFTVAWTPAAGSCLARLGVDWFGWCAERGERHPGPVFDALKRPFAEIVREAPLGCLGAPLVAGIGGGIGRRTGGADGGENGARFALEARVARLAERLAPVEIGTLEVVRRPDGLALAPSVPSVALARAARAVAEAFGTAPAAEFCLPLTGPVSEAEADILSARLTCLLRPEMRRGHRLGELTLVAEAGEARRALIVTRFELGGAPAGRGDGPGDGALRVAGPETLAPEPDGRAARRSIA